MSAIRIDVGVGLFFLFPSIALPNEPTNDTVLSGSIVLDLPKPKKVKRIQIDVVGKQSLRINGRYEDYETLHKTLILDASDNNRELPAGSYTYAFSFIIPSNTAPFEFSPFGTTKHFVRAIAYGAGSWPVQDLSAFHELDIVANENPENGIAEGCDLVSEQNHTVLGPLRVHLYSRYLLRGGYLRFALAMPAVSQPVELVDVSVLLLQTVLLQHMYKPHRREQIEFKILLWALSDETGMTPEVLQAGKDYPLVRQMRLATNDSGRGFQHAESSDSLVRPSTNANSETGIRVTHKLIVVIRYRPLDSGDDSEVKEMRVSFPTQIASCACSIENLQLPEYSGPGEDTASTSAKRINIQAARRLCLCHRPTGDELEKIYGADSKVNPEDYFGAERNRQPLWLSKTEEERLGNDVIHDLLR